MEKITSFLVTGATGFIGRHVVEEIIKNPSCPVKCLIRRNKDRNLWQHKNVSAVLGDLSDKQSLEAALCGVDICIHLAAIMNSKDKSEFERVNIRGMTNLIEASLQNSVKKIIYISSIDAEINPHSLYGGTKLAAENILKKNDLNYTILRPTVVYGNYDHKHISAIINFIKHSPIIPILGNGEYKRQPVYVGDLVHAIKKCIQSGRSDRKTYNVAGPYVLSMNNIVETILSVSGKKRLIIHVPLTIIKKICLIFGKLNRYLQAHTQQIMSLEKDKITDIKRIQEELDFQPVEFQQGLKIMLSEGK